MRVLLPIRPVHETAALVRALAGPELPRAASCAPVIAERPSRAAAPARVGT